MSLLTTITAFTAVITAFSAVNNAVNPKKVAQLASLLYLCIVISRIDVLPRAGNGMFPLRANRGTCHGTKQLKINNPKTNDYVKESKQLPVGSKT
jgi:hypothetical protein